jgi:hypothetical protein
MDGDGVFEVPDDADAVCVGDSPHITDLDAGDSQCVRIRDMADSHAVLYTNKRESVQTLYALKRPLFYQEDSVDVTREQLARLVARDGLHTDRGRLAHVLQKVAAMPSRIVCDLFADPVVAPVLMDAKVATDCGWSPKWAADMLARQGASRI